MNSKEFFESLNTAYDNSDYPDGFLKQYNIMECLAEKNGIDTFLIQDHNSTKYVAKCYYKALLKIDIKKDILIELSHDGFPKHIDTFENDTMYIIVREYIEGTVLDEYASLNDLSEDEIKNICVKICDLLGFLHHKETPIIHRDIKPQNIIIRPDDSVALIDFDIAREYQSGNDTDTVFFGTLAYAPPEQYGFSQTDARADIYSLGVLLRYLLTGSTRENKNIKVYRPLEKIIKKCTAFDPKERFNDVDEIKKALLKANPKSQGIKIASICAGIVLCAVLLTFGGIKIYQKITYNPFSDDAIPAYMSDEERITDAVSYMKDKYNTDLFDASDDIATIGYLREVLISIYGLDRAYVYGINMDMPQESDEYFLPWGWDDGQTIDRDVMVYAAVKAYDPSIVADWSSLKDDNGYYPGVRVAVAFAEDTGILTGVNRPGDLTVGDVALILANTDRVFENKKQ